MPGAYAFSNGENASIVLGQPDFTSKSNISPLINQSRFDSPNDVKFDSSGNLWVVDSANSRVLEFKPPFSNGESASLVLGEPNFNTAYLPGGTPVNGTVLGVPEAIAFDSSGNLWVSDTGDSRIVEFKAPFSTGENASLVLGEPDLKTPGDTTQPASQSNLNAPVGLVFDSSGNLWVADAGYYRVVEFKAPFSNGESASLVLGQDNFTAKNFPNEPGCPPNCGSPTQSTLNSPMDVAFDASGNLWVADRSDYRVVEFTPPFSNGQAASLILGGACAIFGQLLGANCLEVTEFIAFDHSGMLWVSDTGNGRILGFPAPISSGENATVVLGQPDFATTFSNIWNATQSILITPEGIVFDSSGNLWVADSGVNRVLEFGPGAPSSSTSSIASSSSVSSVSSSRSSALPTSSNAITPTSTPSSTTSAPATTITSVPTSSSAGGGAASSMSWVYPVVAVVVVVLVIGAVFILMRRRR